MLSYSVKNCWLEFSYHHSCGPRHRSARGNLSRSPVCKPDFIINYQNFMYYIMYYYFIYNIKLPFHFVICHFLKTTISSFCFFPPNLLALCDGCLHDLVLPNKIYSSLKPDQKNIPTSEIYKCKFTENHSIKIVYCNI